MGTAGTEHGPLSSSTSEAVVTATEADFGGTCALFTCDTIGVVGTVLVLAESLPTSLTPSASAVALTVGAVDENTDARGPSNV